VAFGCFGLLWGTQGNFSEIWLVARVATYSSEDKDEWLLLKFFFALKWLLLQNELSVLGDNFQEAMASCVASETIILYVTGTTEDFRGKGMAPRP
jgi:hypothetical protein